MAVKITIVTPSFNQAQYLEQTLRSVLCQRDQVHEYFVVDGGSTDGSPQIIRRYSAMLDWSVIEKDNGQSDAIQKGFSRATGDVLFWLNSDDVLLPGALAKVREAFNRNLAWDVLTAYHARIDGLSRVMRMYRKPMETQLKMRWGVMRVCQPTCFFKRAMYERVGGLNLSLHYVMDYDLWVRMSAAGAVWGHVPDYLAGFRWHDDAKSSANAPRFAEERERLRAQYPRYSPPRWRRFMGQKVFQLAQFLNGGYALEQWHTWRMRSKPLVQAFGDWVVPGIDPPAVEGDGPRRCMAGT